MNLCAHAGRIGQPDKLASRIHDKVKPMCFVHAKRKNLDIFWNNLHVGRPQTLIAQCIRVLVEQQYCQYGLAADSQICTKYYRPSNCLAGSID